MGMAGLAQYTNPITGTMMSEISNCLDTFIKESHLNLIHNKPKEALEYLESRGISEESIVEHSIGYCTSRDDIPYDIKHFGKDETTPIYSGGCSYVIEGRLILPIYSEFEEAVGLATRKPSHEKGNTWWNLPHPFKKGNHLFLMNKARQNIFKENKAYIVEGYIDAIIAYQHGISNVVALMGTALTQRKIGLLIRYCNNICLSLDIDENESGQIATDRVIYILNEFGFCEDLSMIEGMPVGEDPAQFILNKSVKDFISMEKVLTLKEISQICHRHKVRQMKKKKS
jgi:DNA primase